MKDLRMIVLHTKTHPRSSLVEGKRRKFTKTKNPTKKGFC